MFCVGESILLSSRLIMGSGYNCINGSISLPRRIRQNSTAKWLFFNNDDNEEVESLFG